jgi:hypothetical protein
VSRPVSPRELDVRCSRPNGTAYGPPTDREVPRVNGPQRRIPACRHPPTGGRVDVTCARSGAHGRPRASVPSATHFSNCSPRQYRCGRNYMPLRVARWRCGGVVLYVRSERSRVAGRAICPLLGEPEQMGAGWVRGRRQARSRNGGPDGHRPSAGRVARRRLGLGARDCHRCEASGREPFGHCGDRSLADHDRVGAAGERCTGFDAEGRRVMWGCRRRGSRPPRRCRRWTPRRRCAAAGRWRRVPPRTARRPSRRRTGQPAHRRRRAP